MLRSWTSSPPPPLWPIKTKFYKMFWIQIKDNLIQVDRELFFTGISPVSLRMGIVTLLEKKGKDRLEIAN